MIDKLRKFGLSEYESKCYIALVKWGAQTGRDVSKKSKVPPTRVFDVLHKLVDLGLASVLERNPMVFKAVTPSVGLKLLVKQKTETLEEAKKKVVEELKEATVYKMEPIHESITTFLGYRKMFSQVTELLKRTKREFFVFSVGEEVPYSLKMASMAANRRGVKLKLIVSRSDEENKHILREREKEGYSIKHYPSTGDYTFAVFDRKTCLINVKDPKNKEERISIFFENPNLSRGIIYSLEAMWKKANWVK